MSVLKCECSEPGYCKYHNINKTNELYKACKLDRATFSQFEVENPVDKPVVPPSILEKAINYVSAEIKHTYHGRGEVSPKVYDYRMNICKSCPLFVESDKTCLKCGCYLEVKCKWIEQSCPEGKWKSELEENNGKCGSCG